LKSDVPSLIDRLEQHYGAPSKPLPKKALDWVLWENAAYLLPDKKRAQAFRALKKATGLSARGILGVPREELHALAELGGMLKSQRVAKWLAIAETVQDEFDGDLEGALALPLGKARSALKKFPGIAAPGADKILLFTDTHALPALESNGLRVLVRLGFATEGKSYSVTYKSAIEALAPYVELGCAWLRKAHVLLRTHGREPCKNSDPHCAACPFETDCPSA